MKRAALFCPGRGSYTEQTLGSLSSSLAFVQRAEELRAKYGLPSLVELDRAPRFSAARHLDPVNASALIWLVSMIHAEEARQEREIVCIGGNSMGWYTALTAAGAVSFDDGFRLAQGMALLQAEHARGQQGGQLMYPLVDEDWQRAPEREELVRAALAGSAGQAFPSIDLGGYAVLAGTPAGLEHLQRALPAVEHGRNRYPLRLAQHGPYHTPLVAAVASRAQDLLPKVAFRRPAITLVDGRGARFTPWSADPDEIRAYTFGTQVTEPYDFARGVRLALREYNPDELVLPGPGTSLAGIVGQIVALEGWRGIRSRADFKRAMESERAPLWLLGS